MDDQQKAEFAAVKQELALFQVNYFKSHNDLVTRLTACEKNDVELNVLALKDGELLIDLADLIKKLEKRIELLEHPIDKESEFKTTDSEFKKNLPDGFEKSSFKWKFWD